VHDAIAYAPYELQIDKSNLYGLRVYEFTSFVGCIAARHTPN
jgi:hypothetical protein